MATPGPIDPTWKYLTAFHRGITQTCEICPERAYLSLKLPRENAYPNHRLEVKRIVFSTVSHDQGWADGSSQEPTYASSNTFIDARIIDEDGSDRTTHERVVTNLRAHAPLKSHTVCWDYRDHEGRDAEGRLWPSGMVPSTWLAAIKAGDNIELVPKAEFIAWVNTVTEARIEAWIQYTEVDMSLKRHLTMNMSACYAPLRHVDREIRLVVLEAASEDSENEPLRLTLRRTSLGKRDTTSYEALSYTWVDETKAYPIILATTENPAAATTMFIRKNLYNALKRLRQAGIEDRMLWIDLICINQQDNEERNQQVALMGEIFARAQRIHVWLGEINENIHTRTDLEAFKSIAKWYEKDTTKIRSTGLKNPHYETHEPIVDSTSQIALVEHDRIFLQPWFQRVWVLQEAWNAPSDDENLDQKALDRVTVHCGEMEIPWWVIMQANVCIYQNYHQHRNNMMPPLWMELFDVGRTHNPSWQFGTRGKRHDILDALIGALDMKATNPRDKIFALLLFGKETYDIANLPDLVRPDYNKSVSRVYADFTLWWIETHQSLRILSAVHVLKGRSWLDMSSDCSSGSDIDHQTSDMATWSLGPAGQSRWRYGTLALVPRADYNACGDSKVDLELLKFEIPPIENLDPDRSVLPLRGLIISTITTIRPFSRAGVTEGLMKAYSKIFDPAGTSGTWKNQKVTWSMLHRGSNEYARQNYYQHLQAHVVTNADHDLSEGLPCFGRCRFETVDGREGLCPAGARPGDTVGVLYGGNVPYLLRATAYDGAYEFVGECYLEEAMHGEALQENNGELEESVFYLI